MHDGYLERHACVLGHIPREGEALVSGMEWGRAVSGAADDERGGAILTAAGECGMRVRKAFGFVGASWACCVRMLVAWTLVGMCVCVCVSTVLSGRVEAGATGVPRTADGQKPKHEKNVNI